MSYVTIHEKYRMKHVQVPKVFFTNEKYIKLSNDSKIAYALLLDRHNLSEKNDWIEEGTGRIYFIFTQAEICSLLNCGSEKWQKVKKELVKAGLLEFIRMGLKQPNKMFIKWPDVTDNDIYKIRDMESSEIEKDASNPWGSSEVRKSNFKKFENRTSRSTKIEFQEVRKSNTSNTDLNNTDLSNTDINNLSISKQLKEFLAKHEIKGQQLKAIEELDGLIDEQIYCSIILQVLQNKRVKNFKMYLLKSIQNYKQQNSPNSSDKTKRRELIPEWFDEAETSNSEATVGNSAAVEQRKKEVAARLEKFKKSNTEEIVIS